ncbi:BREX-2 system phosphatase PglZ [Promicromonospora soli]|uniref:PglZ domain-containing protein n=1 Tax=Promicromonospora soli TaxID=2035533 RepID=A0A919G6C9_9MICO|nr:BREX-2 system phosphatase PglZ [Promicromonospora soli]GHH78644.1 hypothetical protein GCM10017772_42410 [Promicromonospora soli]
MEVGVTVTAGTVRTVVVSPAMVRQKAAALLKAEAQVLVLRARPEWPHGDLVVDGRTVRIVEGISQLAILDAYENLGEHDKLVVLTDRTREDLGESVLVRAHRQQVDQPDEWAAVPGLFVGAHEVSSELRRRKWVATALLDHEPTAGWPASAEPALTAQHALGSLLAHLLRLDPATDLDSVLLLTGLGRREVRAAWAEIDEVLRGHLIDWAGDDLGVGAAFALQVAQRTEHVAPLSVALAMDVLWPENGGDPSAEQLAARVRVERYVDGRTVAETQAKAVARLARTAMLRLGTDNAPEAAGALRQAEVLLSDLGWPEGARESTVLRPGLQVRLEALGTALDAGTGFEEALTRVREHRDGRDLDAPEMAVRLARWLAAPEASTANLAEDLGRQMDDGAWADAALGVLWTGADEPVVGAAYRRLIERVRGRRRARDEIAGGRLGEVAPVEVASSGVLGSVALGVEGLLRGVVGPWKGGRGVLLVVLDGMSAAIATQLAGEVARIGMAEWVPSSTRRRLALAAALPSLTEVSRTTLFSGAVRSGDAAIEKSALAAAFPGSVAFHKGELRAEGGLALAAPVAQAVTDPKVPVVGVVINAIDDAAHKNDTSSTTWDLRQLAPLRALLEAAWQAGRAVVITSDHGHVVERGTTARPEGGADSRWRLATSGPVGDGEVQVSGPRVVGPDDGVVLLWRDDLRYGRTHAGYHGGASLAEITVPVLVFQDVNTSGGAKGWEPAPVQTPGWWTTPVEGPAAPADATPVKGQRGRKKSARATDLFFSDNQDALFDIAEPTHAPGGKPGADLVDQILASETYAEQREGAGRFVVDDSVTAAVLRVLLAHHGRAHRDAVAAAAEVAATTVDQMLSVLKRLLNVDGYSVLSTEDGGETVRLDVAMLREQFGVEQ